HIHLPIFPSPVINRKFLSRKFFYIPIMVITETNRIGTLIVESPPPVDVIPAFFPVFIGNYRGARICAVPPEFIRFPNCLAIIAVSCLLPGPCNIAYQGYDFIFPFGIISGLLHTTRHPETNDKNRQYENLSSHQSKNLKFA